MQTVIYRDMMNKQNTTKEIDALIAGYLSDGLEVEKHIILKQWINASPENRKYFNDSQEIWFTSTVLGHEKRFNKNEGYKRFLARKSKYTQRAFPLTGPSIFRIFLYSAAAIVLLLIVSYMSYSKGEDKLKNKFAEVVIEVPFGSNTKMYLPDGTIAWLNAGSKISYSQGFGVNERIIQLKGEAYFEVIKNEMPFSVKTEELYVDVLGTKFNFRNYPEDNEAIVSLLEGIILVNNTIKPDDQMKLLPDQRVFLNKNSGEMRMSHVNAAYTAQWTKGFLFFDEELLPDITKELERSYHVKINLKDQSLETFRFYGNFERKEHTIEEIMDILASTNKIKYKINGKNIELSSN